MTSIYLICLSIFFFGAISKQISLKNSTTELKIAFGSCNKFIWDDESPIFSSITSYEPDVYIWLGIIKTKKNIYLFI